MMLSLIIAMMAALLALQSVLMVLPVPFAQWNWLCWVYIAIAVALVFLCVTNIRRSVRMYKKQKAELKKRQAQQAERARAQRRAQYLEEDIDIEKEAEKAEAARLAEEATQRAAGQAEGADADPDAGKPLDADSKAAAPVEPDAAPADAGGEKGA